MPAGHLSRAGTGEGLGDIRAALNRVLYNQELMMSGLTDLQANLTAMQSEWATFLADMQQALANEDSDTAVEQAAQLVAAQTAAMQAADPVTGTAATPAPGTGTTAVPASPAAAG